MASLVGQQLKDTYDSLLKTSDNDSLGGTYKEITDGSGNGSNLYLGTGGRVGIGASSPASKLHVVLTSDTDDLRIENSYRGHNYAFSTQGTSAEFFVINDVDNSRTLASFGDSGISLNSAGVSRLRIGSGGDISFRDTSANDAFYWDASAGSLGIGTTSPSALLDVEAASPVIELRATTTTATTLGAKNNRILLTSDSTTSGAGGEIVFNTSDSTTGRWGAISGHITENASGSAKGDIVFATKATSGATSLTERMRILSGGGLTFNGDTATANALDDYEEGTWTATLEGASTAGTYTFSTNQSLYTKIGRQVTVISRLVLSTASGGVGSAKFGGLPFTKVADSSIAGSAIVVGVDVDNSTISMASSSSTLAASTDFNFLSIKDNGNPVSVDITGISTGDIIQFSFTYFV